MFFAPSGGVKVNWFCFACGEEIPLQHSNVLRLTRDAGGGDNQFARQRFFPFLEPDLPIDSFLAEGGWTHSVPSTLLGPSTTAL